MPRRRTKKPLMMEQPTDKGEMEDRFMVLEENMKSMADDVSQQRESMQMMMEQM